MGESLSVEVKRLKESIEIFSPLLENRDDLRRKMSLVEETLELGNDRLARAFLLRLEVEFLYQLTSYFNNQGSELRLSDRMRDFLKDLERKLLEEKGPEAFQEFLSFSIHPEDIITDGVGEEEEIALPDSEYQDALDYVEKIFEYIQKRRLGGEEGKEISEMFIQMKKRLKEGDFQGVKKMGEELVEKFLPPREQFKFALELKLLRLEGILKEIQAQREVLGVDPEGVERWGKELLEIKRAVQEGFLLKADLKLKEIMGEVEPHRERIVEEMVKGVLDDLERKLGQVGVEATFERFLFTLARKRFEERRYKEAYEFAVKAKRILRERTGVVDESLKEKVMKYEVLVGALMLPEEQKKKLLQGLERVRERVNKGDVIGSREALRSFEDMLLEMAER